MAEPARRPLWTVVGALLIAAAALWASGRLDWAVYLTDHPDRQLVGDGLGGTGVGSGAAGSVPDLSQFALLALAGVAGAVAVGGWLRRLLGILVAAAGAFASWLTVSADIASAPGVAPGRAVALLGGVLLVIAGAVLIWFGDRMPALGTRYQRAHAERRAGDPDRDMWEGLSEGKDPTTDDG